MNEVEKNSVREMIAAELSGKMPGLHPALLDPPTLSPTGPETPVAPAPEPVQQKRPTYPPEVPLDEYEALMVNGLRWRVEAAEKTQVLLSKEKIDINDMRHTLLNRVINRLQIDVNEYNIQIDSATKQIKIEKR